MPSDSETPVAIARASAPFDDPRGDIILRTSDNVDFQVFKIILELASPAFKAMLSLPQPPEDSKGEDSVPIVPLSETSTTLDSVLRFCYPVKQPDLDKQDLSTIGAVLRAAMKYDIDAAVYPARRALMDRLSVDEESALAVYAIACSLKLDEEARSAAYQSLRWPVLRTLVPQFASMSGTDCYHLVDYHRRVGQAAANLFRPGSFREGTLSTLWPRRSCPCSKEVYQLIETLPSWLFKIISDLENSVKTVPLDEDDNLFPSNICSDIHSQACNPCKSHFLAQWEQAKKKIRDGIRVVIEEVDLTLSWE